jgi:hypothetical protein
MVVGVARDSDMLPSLSALILASMSLTNLSSQDDQLPNYGFGGDTTI